MWILEYFGGTLKPTDAHDWRHILFKLVQALSREFEIFQLTKVPWEENVCADILAALGSKLRDLVKCTIPIQRIEKPSIDLLTEKNLILATVTEATSIEEDLVTEKNWKTNPILENRFHRLSCRRQTASREMGCAPTKNPECRLCRHGWKSSLMDHNKCPPQVLISPKLP